MPRGPPRRSSSSGVISWHFRYYTKYNFVTCRNLQKAAKRVRHSREKDFMEALGRLGNVVGVYAGDGQGEVESVTEAEMVAVGADVGIRDLLIEQNEESSEDAHPLLFLYDCETTGLSIYSNHIMVLWS